MNTLNRILVIALVFISAMFWAGVIFSVWAFPREMSSSLGNLAAYMRANVGFVQIMVTIFGTASILVALLLLLAEISPQEDSVVHLPQVKGGTVLITTESIAQQVKHYVDQVPQVRLIRTVVSPAGTAVDILLELGTDSDANTAEKSTEVCQVVRDCVEGRIGLKLRRLTVNVHFEPFTPSPAKAIQGSPVYGTDPSEEILVPSASEETGKGEAPKDQG